MSFLNLLLISPSVLTKPESGNDAPFAGEAPSGDGKVELRAAALDAYRVSNQSIPVGTWMQANSARFSMTYAS